MSKRTDARLLAIAAALNPYHDQRYEIGDWQYTEWQRGFVGSTYLGYFTTVQFQVYNQGVDAFTSLSTRKNNGNRIPKSPRSASPRKEAT